MLRSTTDAYLRLLEVPAGPQRQAAWAEAYEAAHPDVFDVYYDGRGDPARRHDAADAVEELAPSIPEREERAANLVRFTASSMQQRGWLDRAELRTVLMVGSGTSNGWVAHHEGEPTLFLALESLPAPPFDTVLVAHEAAHVAHALGSAMTTWPTTVQGMTFVEGVAVAASRELCPGLSESAYLWFDEDHAAWVQECQEAATVIEALAASAWTSDDDAVRGRLFQGGSEPATVPSRAGYWLADRQAERALMTASLADLLTWTASP